MIKLLILALLTYCLFQCQHSMAQCGANVGLSLEVYSQYPNSDLTALLVFDNLDSNTDNDFDDLRLVENGVEMNICSNRLKMTDSELAIVYSTSEITVTFSSPHL
jgi:hypothetical protein